MASLTGIRFLSQAPRIHAPAARARENRFARLAKHRTILAEHTAGVNGASLDHARPAPACLISRLRSQPRYSRTCLQGVIFPAPWKL